jgi:DNA-binding NarL/FixJ family response regulator
MVIRCLIVDDSDRLLRSARSLLEQGGVAVVGVASNSTEALERMAEAKPDVMLLDINLGGESGFDLARQVHQLASGDGGRPAVILTSSYAQEDFEELIAASPVAGFLPKSALSAGTIHHLLYGVLLRCRIGRRVEARGLVSGQIARASSVNAAATRWAGGASIPSS